MNKHVFFLLIITFFLGRISMAQNPFITHMYTADPSARVFDNRLYVYPSHDKDSATWWDMEDYHVFSTTDMKNWKDHGKVLDLADITWAEKYAWAPDCVERNGKYYFYFPTDQFHIGVAVSDKPYGPFKDELRKPLISKNSKGVVSDRDFIDPAAFIDDDGQAYLFMGQNTVNAIKLNEDMMSYDGEVHIIEGANFFFEAAWVHKYQGIYYLSYSGKKQIHYAMSDNILGPYKYQGVILDTVNSGTNHHSITEYKGKWYLFYHNADLAYKKFGNSLPKNILQKRRSICVDYLEYNNDGTIKPVKQTKESVEQIKAKY
ncbi:family 43 glycosylhydrolase [Maribacter luteus]|uniref:family 43 glycosylhydrolase n=1 Tax=Maribacter luteus TaxID=2594478 RepID=UPI0024921DC3|nr:family 43 glycosylhydrolase [Maribacter luteus]